MKTQTKGCKLFSMKSTLMYLVLKEKYIKLLNKVQLVMLLLRLQLALLEYGILFLNFSGAISEGNGLRILRCWKFFLMLVDTYIVNETNINVLMEKLQKEQRADVGVLSDGRFGCRFPGCKKSFTFDGKRRVAHEKTHGLHAHSSTSIPTSAVKDDVRNYQLALLEYGILFLNFSGAISEGNGLRILRCWKFFLMLLKEDGASSRKYALEGLHLISQVYATLSPRDAHRLIWNRSVKSKYGMGGDIPLDLALEHYNRVLKEVIKKMVNG